MEKILQLKKGNFFKINAAIAFIVSILFLGSSNEAYSQAAASATWALTSNGNVGSPLGAITANNLVFGGGVNSPSYSGSTGISTSSWSNDANSLVSNEYYEYKVTPTSGNILTVTSITGDHSRDSGNWLVGVYYSLDGFATSAQVGSNLSINSSSSTAFSRTGLSYVVPAGTTFSVRIYAWESDSGDIYRNRNVVISGTTCQAVAISSQPIPQNLCAGATLSFTPTISNASGYQWYKNGTAIGGATSASYSKANIVAGDAGDYYVIATGSCGGPIVSNSVAVTVSPLPTSVVASSNLSTICSGASVNLTSSATNNSSTRTLISQNFNGALNGWTKINNSFGGTPANAAWTLRPDGYNYSVDTFNSNDASQFYLSNSDAQGSGSNTITTLQSPSFSTSGLSAASLSFYHYYRYNGTESAVVQISTDGTNWTALNTYTSTQGADNGFVLVTTNLASYLGQATVYIRFVYNASFDWYWAIDNVAVTGTLTAPAASYAWTSTPALFTSSNQNPTNVAPLVNTVYNVSVTNAYGCSAGASTASVTVNALPTTSAISGLNIVCATSAGVAYSVTNTAGSSYAWTITGGTKVSGGTTNSIIVNWGAAGAGNVSVLETNAATCAGTAVNQAVTINALPTTSAISGLNIVCATSAGVAYSVINTAGSLYAWTITGGAQASGGTTNSITVNWGAAGPGNVSVLETNAAACTGTAINSLVTINALPSTSAISGLNSVCATSTGVAYNVTNTAGSSYAWTITGGTQTSGGTTNSITVDWGAAGAGNVSVLETNAAACTGTVINSAVTINALPSTSAISGLNNVCASSIGVAYSVTNTLGSSYAWTITGGTQASGGTTNSITVDWGAAGAGDVSVLETNALGCVGSEINSAVTITANSTPTASLTSSDLDNNFAYGTSVIFTASAGSLGGGTASYNFKVNGVSVQNGALATYTVSNLANSDQVSVVVTVSGGTCLTSPTATSNTITNTVTGAYISVITTYCGQTLPIINAKIRCSVPTGLPGGATLGYMIKVRNTGNINNVAVTFPSSVANFNLTMSSVYAYSTVFEVQVAAVVNGVVQPYSAICLMTTPGVPANTVTTVQCGTTLTELSTRIYASAVLGSQLYRWKVRLSTDPDDVAHNKIYTTLSSSFRLTNVPGLAVSFGKTYIVAVQSDVLINGATVTSPYSTVCNISTPNIAIITSAQCGTELETIDQRIYINSIIGANQYTYRVALATNPGVGYEYTTTNTNFRLTSVPGLPLTFETAYVVSVKVRLTIDTVDYFSDFSENPCTITTPEAVTVGLQAAYCTDGDEENPGPYQVPSIGSLIYCEFVSGAYYTFVFQQVNELNVSIGLPFESVLRSVNNVNLQNVPGIVADALYKVTIRLTYYGEGETGKACTIHIPAAAREEGAISDKVTFSATAYPNPFANNFMIDVKTRNESAVSLKVYDMIGRLVEQRSVSVSDLETTPIGDNYPSGVYNVVVTQGDDVKTVRVVKR